MQWVNSLSSAPRPDQDSEIKASLLGLEAVVTSPEKLDVLELGSGTGILALAVAALRSRIADAEDKILTTDLDSAIPLLQHNIDANRSIYPEKISLEAGVLDWDQSLKTQLPEESGFDLVVMADVAYNTDSFPALVQTLAGVPGKNPGKKPLFVMGYKERHDEERTLWDMAKSVGINFVQVGTIPGHASGGAPIEIWIA